MAVLCACVPRLLLLLGLFCHALSFPQFMSELCDWCDDGESVEPSCNEDRTKCTASCDFASFCNNTEDVCASFWTTIGGSLRVENKCLEPKELPIGTQLPPEGQKECVMQEWPGGGDEAFFCICKSEQLCNVNLVFPHQRKEPQTNLVVLLSLLPLLAITLLMIIGFYAYRVHRKRNLNHTDPKVINGEAGRKVLLGQGDSSDRCGLRDDQSDISSTCANNLNHNTELLPIELDVEVGKGRFARVRRAKLRQNPASGHFETVAVKIFRASEVASWQNEKEIFSLASLKHDSILHFLTAEERLCSGSSHESNGLPGMGKGTLNKEYWLITAYHPRGNLQELLAWQVLAWQELSVLGQSLAHGVAHLHADRTACGQPKMPIAHRDIKSPNILVKADGTCCLCDFGLSLRLDPALSIDELANHGQVGTARYMAPEVMESRINLEDLEAFKQVDVYAMGLVIWEMASRCDAIGDVQPYKPPFGEKVHEHPCVESMKDIVLRERGRPDIPGSWRRHSAMSSLCETMIECWDPDPEARLTANCVVERFLTMRQEYGEGCIWQEDAPSDNKDELHQPMDVVMPEGKVLA
uniref:TGF-beta receptor type-2-like n=2 Tax=Myxine glutinosa TaxID=7769 RepID=UPI00358E416F